MPRHLITVSMNLGGWKCARKYSGISRIMESLLKYGKKKNLLSELLKWLVPCRADVESTFKRETSSPGPGYGYYSGEKMPPFSIYLKKIGADVYYEVLRYHVLQ